MAKKSHKVPDKELPKTTIEPLYDLTKLVEHPDNPRTLDRAAEAKLAASIDEFGLVDTITANVRDDGSVVVLGGHQRLKVLLKRGTTQAPVTLVKVSESQERRLLLLLNGHHGKWDNDKLGELLEMIQESGDDISNLGLDGVEGFEQTMALLKEAEQQEAPAAEGDGAAEIDVGGMELKHRCPKCGFEFDKSTTSEGGRDWGGCLGDQE
jgi:hypothetical protein